MSEAKMTQAKKQRNVSARRKIQISDVKGRKNLKRPSKIKIDVEKNTEPIKEEVQQEFVDQVRQVAEMGQIENQRQAKQPMVQVEQPVAKAQQMPEKRPMITRFADNQRTEKMNSRPIIKEVESMHSDMLVMQNKKIDDIRQRVQRAKQAKKPARLTAKQIKEQEIQRAFNMANVMKAETGKKSRKYQYAPIRFGFRRVLLALACAVVSVLAIVYFVNINYPDITLKVAAMQTGINAVYPQYTPRGYSLSDITAENGRILINYKNAETGEIYSITEENSSWNSTALQNNYVKEQFGANYTKVEENGISVFISANNAAWVNNGILFKLTVTSGSLTRKQITTIATSK